MPPNLDSERSIENEETPLLREERNDDVEGGEELDGHRRKIHHFRTAAWTILFIGIVLLFIKGWQDAGKDVNVSFCVFLLNS